MKSPVIAFLSALLGAFLAGFGVYQYMDQMIDGRIAQVRREVQQAHERLDGTVLAFGQIEFGDRFGAQAGDERNADDEAGKKGRTERHVMVGQWDGTGTRDGWSRNFYREIGLRVPPRSAAP